MTTYKRYEQRGLLKDWEELVQMNREEVVRLEEEWEKVEKHNEEVYRNNIDLREQKTEEIAQNLKSAGVEVYRYSKRDPNKVLGYLAWFKNNVAEAVNNQYSLRKLELPRAYHETREVFGVKVLNSVSPIGIVRLYDIVTQRFEQGKKEIEEGSKLLQASIEYAKTNNIDIEDLTTKQINREVDEYAKKRYLDENVPEGTQVELDHECEYCSTYTVGERRCDCGNRRICVEVGGDLLEGYYYYPEAY